MKTYSDVLMDIKNAINKYKTGISYLKLFPQNPDAIANEIFKLNDEVLTKSFDEIKKGLKGEFTRQQATSMGSRLIVAAIVKSGNDISLAFEERDNYLKSVVKLIRDIYFSSTENMELSLLVKRRDIYRREPELTKFFEARAGDKLSPQILKDVGTGEELLNYFTRVTNILEEIKTNQPIADLSDRLNDYVTFQNIASVLEKNGIDDTNNTTLDVNDNTAKVVEITDDTLRALALRFLQNTNVVNTKETAADAMDDIINNLPLALSSVTASLKVLELMDEKFPTAIDNIKELVALMNLNVEQFAKATLSMDALEKTIDSSIARLVNRYNATIVFDAELLLNLSKFGRQLYNINNTYILADTATLYGTIPDNS